MGIFILPTSVALAKGSDIWENKHPFLRRSGTDGNKAEWASIPQGVTESRPHHPHPKKGPARGGGWLLSEEFMISRNSIASGREMVPGIQEQTDQNSSPIRAYSQQPCRWGQGRGAGTSRKGGNRQRCLHVTSFHLLQGAASASGLQMWKQQLRKTEHCV